MSTRIPSSICRAAIAALALAVPAVLGAPPAPATAAETCPNEEIRAEQGAERLPDCRAFELVTPEVKGDDGAIGAAEGIPYGFPDGNHVYYASLLPLPGAESGVYENVLSSRTPSGWVNTALAPVAAKGEPVGLFSGSANNSIGEVAFTGNFAEAFVNSSFTDDPLDQDGLVDAYRFDLASHTWSLAALPQSGPLTPALEAPHEAGGEVLGGTFIAGATEDGGQVFFETMDQLSVAPGTPGEPHAANMLYDRAGGNTYAVGVLPNGTVPPSCDVELGDGSKNVDFQGTLVDGAIAPDGTNVVFTTQPSFRGACPEPGVYLREDNARTVQLSGAAYVARSADGAKVFTAGGEFEQSEGIYEYDIATGTTTQISAEGWYVAASAGGSRVYYLIDSGPNAGLHLWENGTSKLIPGAGEGFASTYRNKGGELVQNNVAVATPDGSRLLFLDTADLTGYDSFGPTCLEGRPANCTEAYVYDANNGSITCISCNPTGAPPLGDTHLMADEQKNTLLPPYSEGEISPDGSRVFFETADALVPQDTNGLPDVYEWENGRIYLISSGQGTYGSGFAGASSNGDDVFFVTTDHLAPQDIESSTEIYDARVDGGFHYEPFTSGCDSGQCQGPQTPAPDFSPPASATFVGLGNPVPATTNVKVKAKPKAKRKQPAKAKRRSKSKRRRGRTRQKSPRAPRTHTATSRKTDNGKHKGRK